MTATHDGRSDVGLTARRRGAPALALVGCLLVSTLGGCGTPARPAPRSAEATYGGLPGWLPTSGAVMDSVLIGTADHPALTTQGEGVTVRLPGASVLVTVTGPEVPGEGLPYVAPATTCTWIVTMTGATAPVPIVIGDFTSLDHLGVVYRPALVPGQPRPPAVIRPGQSITFELRAIMTVGEGLMRWSPANRQTVASWDFEVEND